MTRLFWRKPFTVTLAFVMALALPLCGVSALLAAAEDNDIIYQEVEADGGGDDVVYEDIILDDEPADDETEENSEPEEADEADEDNGGEEPAIMAYAEIEDDGEDNGAPDEDIEDGDNEDEQAMYLGEADDDDDNVATPGNTEDGEEESEDEEAEQEPEQDPEEPQIITIASFAELDSEITDQRLVLPQEDETPLNLGDIHFPMSLDATDTDGNNIAVELDMWLGEDYDLEVEGEYIFTAKRPDGYALADGVAMPKITVTVTSSDNAAQPPQIITIAAFAELAEEILYQGFDLPAEDAPPLTLEDIDFPASLEATDTDENGVTVAVDWHCEDYDLAAMGMYTFTAKLPDGYALGDGASMPQIIVIVRPADLAIAAVAADISVGTLEELQQAIEDAGTEETTITLTATVTASGDVTLDGTNKNITITRASDFARDMFEVYESNASLTFENITIDGGTSSLNGAVLVFVQSKFIMKDGAILQNNNTGQGAAVYVASGGVFNMEDGEISNNTSTGTGGGVYNSGTFNMSGGEISNNTANKGGGVHNSGTFNMSGGTISGNTATTGGGMHLESGSFNMTDGEISNNTAGNGAGVSIYGGTFTMTGGKIIGNVSTGYYGGVEYYQGTVKLGGTAIISGNTLKGNVNNLHLETSGKYITLLTGADAPNGMYVGVTLESGTGTIVSSGASEVMQYYFFADDSTKKVTYSSGVLSVGAGTNPTALEAFKAQITAFNSGSSDMTINVNENITLDAVQTISNASGKTLTITGGGTITRGVEGDLFTVSSGTGLILQNITIDGDNDGAFPSGGGSLVYANYGTLTMNSGAVLQNNSSSGEGGGVYVYAGTFTMNDGMITENTTTGNGGGVYVGYNSTFAMTGGRVSNNTAEYGGGVSVSSGTFTMSGDAKISDNTGNIGGGVHVSGGSFTMNGGTISGNVINWFSGGGVYIEGTFTLGGTAVISGNTESDGTTANNVYLPSGKYITLSDEAPPADGMNIYVTTVSADGKIVSSGADETIAGYFHPDDSIKILELVGDSIVIRAETAFEKFVKQVAAYETATDNTTITVSEDFTLTSLVTIPANASGKTLTITSDGTVRTITRGVAGDLFTVSSGANLVLQNITIDGDKDGAFATGGGSLVNVNGGSLTMNSGAALQNNAAIVGGGVEITGGTFTMNSGATLQNNAASEGGGVNMNSYGSTFTMNGGEITGNTAAYGGGVCALYGIFNMNGGRVSGNSCGTDYNNYGGGVYHNCTLTLGGTAVISGNTKSGAANNLYLPSGKTITLSDEVPPADGMNIGVTHETTTGDVAITSGTNATEEIADYFTSDNADRIVICKEDGVLYLADAAVSISGAAVAQDGALTYNGIEQTPAFTVTVGGETLVAGTDYTVTGSATDAGDYTATITGIGGYKDEITDAGYTIGKATPTINFTAIATTIAGNTVTLSASSNSDGTGSAITYSSSDTAIATISGSSVTLLKTGAVTLTATQAESTNYEAATATQNITVTLPNIVMNFAQLKAAVASYADATANMTITVGADITMTELLTIPANSGKTLTIRSDSTVRTIKRGSGVTGNLFTVPADASLILQDITLDGGKTAVTSAGGSLVYVNGALTMNDGTVLQNNKTENGGGVNVSGGSFTMNGGTISGNICTSTASGGGGILNSGTFTMSGGEIINNQGTYGGGIRNSGTFTMTGGKIKNNTADTNGGGIRNSSTLIITGGEISGNEVTGTALGGGVYHSGTAFTLGGNVIINGNTKGEAADNVYLDSTARKITLSTDIPPTNGMKIGITHANTSDSVIVQANASAAIAEYFFSDVEGRMVIFESDSVNNMLKLVNIVDISTDTTITASQYNAEYTYYTGAPITPQFTVNDGPTNLTGGTHYSVTVTPQTDAGTYTGSDAATITGIGKYTGTLTVPFTIKPKAATVSPSAGQSKTYGEDDPTFTFVNNALPSAVFTGALSRTEGEGIGTYAYNLGDLSAGSNYTLSLNASNTFAITAKALTIESASHTKAYDGGTTADGVTVMLSGMESGDSDVTADTVTAVYTSAAAGTSTINISAVTLTGTNAGNYTVTSANGVSVAGITKKPLTDAMITGNIAAVTYTGSAHTPTPTVADGAILQTSDYEWSYSDNTDAGTATATITATDNGNYSGIASKDFTIDKASLTIEVEDINLTYGDDAPDFGDFEEDTDYTVTGLVNGETLASLGTLSFAYDTESSDEYTKNSPASKYYIDAFLDGAQDNTTNYAITYNSGTVTVNKRALSDVTVADIEAVTYKGEAHEPVPTVSDGNIAITTNDYEITGYSDNINAGTARVTLTAKTDGNYTGGTDKTFTIEQAPLTITADDKGVDFGDAPPEYTAQYAGFVKNEADSKGDLTGDLIFTCTYTQDSAGGDYDIVPSGLSSNNYKIKFVNGTLSVGKIDQAALVISGVPEETITYGDDSFTISTGSSGSGDGAVTFATSNDNVLAVNASTGLVTIKGAGDATITATKDGGTDYVDIFATVQITVAQAALTVTANDDTITYGDDVPNYTVTYSAFAYSDGKDDLEGTLVFACDYEQGDDADEYTITPSGLTSENYDITFTYGTLTVNRAEQSTLTITDPGTKTWGDTAFSLEATGGDGTDTVTYALTSGDDVISIDGSTVTILKAGTATVTATKAASTNYNEKTSAETTITINPRNISNASISVTSTHTYTGLSQTPTFTVTDSGAAITSNDYDVTYGENKNVSTGGSVSFTAKGNYTGEAVTKSFDIAKATLTVTAENKTVSYGAEIPAYTYTITDYVNNETASVINGTPTLSCPYEKGNNVGGYVIRVDVDGLSAANYSFTKSNGELDVIKTSGATVSDTPAVAMKTAASITVNSVANAAEAEQSTMLEQSSYAVQRVEYALSTTETAPAATSDWQESTTFTELDHSTTYYAFARTAANINYYAGVAQMSAAIETDRAYTVNLTVNKDNTAYDLHGKTFYLKDSTKTYTGTGSGGAVTFANVLDGYTYKIYDGEADTGATVTVNNSDATKTLNYYTVQFAVTNSGAASGSTIKATYDGAEISSGTIVGGGKSLVLTASGKGASTYSYSWTVNGAKDGSTSSITISNLANAVDAVCTVSGTAASSSRESSSSREESSSQAEESSAVEESSSQAESSIAESSASSSEAEQPASSASEASSEAQSSSESSESSEAATESSAAESSAAESSAEPAQSSDNTSSSDNSSNDRSDSRSDSYSDSDSDSDTRSERRSNPILAIMEISEEAKEVVSDIFTTSRKPVGPAMDLQLHVDVGSAIYGREIMLTAKGLKPFTEVKVTVYSEPQLLGIVTADENGEATLWATFPEDLEGGAHTVIADGTGTLDEPVQSVSMVQIDNQGIVLNMMESSQVLEPLDPGDRSLVRAMEAGKPLYDPSRNPGTVASATIAICVTGGGLAAMAGLKKPGDNPPNRNERRRAKGKGAGDRGYLWRILPFSNATDNLFISMQEATSKFSYTLHRILTDGVWARAMFGSGGILLWIFGVGLGAYASAQVGFKALTPDFSIVLAIVALGILDASVGFASWTTIALLSVFSGNITGIDDVCTLLGMFTLFSALMTLCGIRPLHREYEPGKKFIYDRLMDYIIPTVYLMLASSAVLDVINGLSGLELFSEENGAAIKVVSVLAMWVRLIMEDVATNLFPDRCHKLHIDAEPQQNPLLIFGSIALYVTAFILISIPFFKFSSMLMILLALDMVPALMMYIEDRLPNSRFLNQWYPDPDSTYASLIMIVIEIYLTLWVLSGVTDYRQMSVAMVMLAIPAAVAEIPALFGREGYIPKNGWMGRISEFGCWALFAAIALDIIKLV